MPSGAKGNEGGRESLPQLSGKSVPGAGRKVSGYAAGGARRHHKGKWRLKAPTLGGTGVRKNSRVGKLLSEFGGKDDWCSQTILRHKMAVVIQSCLRGYLVRKRWRLNPEAVVAELHGKIERERLAKLRRADAIKKLEVISSVQRGGGLW